MIFAHEIPMKLSGQEFDKRAQEVFLPEYETVYSAIEVEGTDVKVYAKHCIFIQKSHLHRIAHKYFTCIY